MAFVVPDQPELLALASLAGLPASRLAAAFNDPEHFFEHISLEELARFQGACERLGALEQQLMASMGEYTETAKQLLTEASSDAD